MAQPTAKTATPSSSTAGRGSTPAPGSDRSTGDASRALRTTPIVTTLSTVPIPGRTPSAATTATSSTPTAIEAVPTPTSRRPASPVCSTSHGATPSAARMVSQMPAALTTSPPRSWATRPGRPRGQYGPVTPPPGGPAR